MKTTKQSQTRRVMVTLPTSVLKDVDWLAPLEDMTRDQLILTAIKRFLKPHLEIRKQVLQAVAVPGKLSRIFDTHEEFIADLHKEAKELRVKEGKDGNDSARRGITKAICESTDQLKTGRYEP